MRVRPMLAPALLAALALAGCISGEDGSPDPDGDGPTVCDGGANGVSGDRGGGGNATGNQTGTGAQGGTGAAAGTETCLPATPGSP